MSVYNHIKEFKKLHKKEIKSIKDDYKDEIDLEVIENNLKYIVKILKRKGKFFERDENYWCESWQPYYKSKTSFENHRVFYPAFKIYDVTGRIFLEEYYLNGIEYSKKDFFNHPLNKEIIISKRFKPQ